MILSLPAYAKINLYLDIMGKRIDGFHDIKSIMHLVSLCDTVSAERLPCIEEKSITIDTEAPIPCGSDNLVWRAAELFFEFFHIEKYRVRFKIDKKIPVAAGLAGGSSDAGAAIKLLDRLYDTHASLHELCEIGSEIGSDIPFCIMGGTCLTTGRGEILTQIENNLHMKFLIANGGKGISTPAAYKMADEFYKDDGLQKDFGDIGKVRHALEEGNLDDLSKYAYNTFESVIFTVHDKAAAAREIMLKGGAEKAMLCGSGPSVFGIFESEISRNRTYEALKSAGYRAFACETQMKV